MIPPVRNVRAIVAELACTVARLARRSHGRHVARIGADEPWLPQTQAPEPYQPELHHPRVPRYVEAKPLCSEWLSREYAILYSWSAQMEARIYGTNLAGIYG